MQRQSFHITAKEGWINDPNGLVFYKGYYHAFFQFHPYSTEWGPMHWGHVRSKDLVKWEYLPIALYPDGEADKDGCFSGGAIVVGDRLYLMYTGHTVNGGGENIRQRQCLAWTDDGITFTKHPRAIIDEQALPSGFSACDFRDPCVFRNGESFYALIAARKGDSSDILLFRSQDLFSWNCVGPILDYPSSGKMIECPSWDARTGVLFYCDVLSQPKEKEHLNIHSNFYRIGSLDLASGKFTTKKEGMVDYGFDFYAQQYVSNSEKPAYLAWMQMWDRNIPSRKYGFAGMQTLPRFVEVKNGELYQTPVCVEEYVRESVCFDKASFNGALTAEAERYRLSFKGEGVRRFQLKIKKGAGEFASYEIVDGQIIFDRSKCGEEIIGGEQDELSKQGKRVMPITDGENFELTLFVDRFSAELFTEGKVMTNTLYAEESSNGISLLVDADKLTLQISSLNV